MVRTQHRTGDGALTSCTYRDNICKKNWYIICNTSSLENMSSHSTCRTPKKRLRRRRFCRPQSRLDMLRMFARLIWPTLFCLLRRQRWRTDWSTLCNTTASAPFSAQQRSCIASGLTAARGTKRRVHIAPSRAQWTSVLVFNCFCRAACMSCPMYRQVQRNRIYMFACVVYAIGN